MPPKESEDPEYLALQKEIEKLKEQIQCSQKNVRDTELEEVMLGVSDVSKLKLSVKRSLKGHIHKVNGVAFAEDSRHLLSGSLDGKLIIWDTWTGNKIQIIPLRSSWVMTVAYSPSGSFVASGGMDNCATVHDLNNRNEKGEAKILRELGGYEGFLSSCKFLSDMELLTGSGDMKLSKWDLRTGIKTIELPGHAGDVVTMSLHPTDNNVLVTGSVDQTAKLWDLRTTGCQQTFYGHTADVNSVCFHPSGMAFGSASEDFTARLFDIRADQEVSQYKTAAPDVGFTSSLFSKSGRYFLSGGDDGGIHMWDVLKTVYLGALTGHEERVTSITISENGIAIASASWDQNVKVWL